MGDISEGIHMSERALEIFKRVDDHINMAFTTYWLGRTAEQRSQFTTAKKYYEESLKYFNQSGSQRDLARPLNQLGDIAYHQCEYDTATKYLNEALDVLRELGEEDRALASFVIVSRAVVYIALNDLAKATSDAERAMANFQRMKFDYGIVQCHICLGDIACQQKEPAKAEKSYLDAIQMAENRKQNSDLGLARRQLAKLWLQQEKLEDALQVCSSALQTYGLISDLHGQASCMQVHGDIFLAMGDTASAEKSYSDALHFLRHLHAIRGSACCMLGLAKIAKSKNTEKEAIKLLLEAESKFSRLGDMDGAAECQRVLNEPPKGIEVVSDNLGKEVRRKISEKTLVPA